jgi:MurNAc alpha-1-phosphate uridylyltransferase
VVINTHYLGSLIESTVRANPMGLTVHFSREETLLETGGGIKKALPWLGENPFVVVNSDAVWKEAEHPLLRPLMAAFNAKKHDALMAVVPTEATAGFRAEGGDYALDKKTHRLKKPRDRKRADVVYTGIHVTHPAFIAFEPQEKFSLVKPWGEAEAEGRLHGHLYKGAWVDMGTHTGLHHARELARSMEGPGAGQSVKTLR